MKQCPCYLAAFQIIIMDPITLCDKLSSWQ